MELTKSRHLLYLAVLSLFCFASLSASPTSRHRSERPTPEYRIEPDYMSSYMYDEEDPVYGDNEIRRRDERSMPLKGGMTQQEKIDRTKESLRSGLGAVPKSKAEREELKRTVKTKSGLSAYNKSPAYSQSKHPFLKKARHDYDEGYEEAEMAALQTNFEDDERRDDHRDERESIDAEIEEAIDISQIESEIAQDPRLNIDAQDLLKKLLRDRYAAIKSQIDDMLRNKMDSRIVTGLDERYREYEDEYSQELADDFEPYYNFDIETFEEEEEPEPTPMEEEHTNVEQETRPAEDVDRRDLGDFEEEYEDHPVEFEDFEMESEDSKSARYDEKPEEALFNNLSRERFGNDKAGKMKVPSEETKKEAVPEEPARKAIDEASLPDKTIVETIRKLSAKYNGPEKSPANYFKMMEQGGLLTSKAVQAYDQVDKFDLRKKYSKFVKLKASNLAAVDKPLSARTKPKHPVEHKEPSDSSSMLEELFRVIIQKELNDVVEEIKEENKREKSTKLSMRKKTPVHEIYGPSDINLYYRNLRESAKNLEKKLAAEPDEPRPQTNGSKEQQRGSRRGYLRQKKYVY